MSYGGCEVVKREREIHQVRVQNSVPWWADECRKIVKERNRALRLLRQTHNVQNLIRYKQAQARVRKIIHKAKRQSWQTLCKKIGRSTPVGEVWGMIRIMRGTRKERQYPVLKMGEEAAVSDEEKTEMLTKALTQMHSSDNLTEEVERKGNDKIGSSWKS